MAVSAVGVIVVNRPKWIAGNILIYVFFRLDTAIGVGWSSLTLRKVLT
jgi:hypothetical protein